MVLNLAVAVLAVVAAGYGAGRFRRWLDRQWFLIMAWRWLSGGEGYYRGRRAAERCGIVAAAVAMLWMWMTAPVLALILTAVLTVAGTGYGGWQLWRLVTGFRHHRTWLRPLHLAARDVAQIEEWRAPRSWLQVERDRSKAVLALPAGWPADDKDKQRLVAITAAKLGLESPEVKWRLAGPKPQLELCASQPPPRGVSLADVRPAIESARADELVWGIGKRGAVIKTSLAGDSPHAGLSMGSGAGKSETAKQLLAQLLSKGAIGLILDYKMISHQWAAGLPNVAIARRPHEIHDALLWLGGDHQNGVQGELERRNEVALAGADLDGNVHATVGPRLIVVCEELNATVGRLRAYWRQIRENGDPVRSPALEALDAASFMGRQVLVNIIYIGQRLSVKASGGDGDARENIGVIGFSRYSPSNWKMLAPDFPMPPKSLAPGRLQVVSDSVREVQGPLLSALEARELATSGIVSPLPAGMPGAPAVLAETLSALNGEPGPDVPFVSGTSPVVPALPGLITLSEAVSGGFVDCSLHAIRKAAQRDPGFPKRAGLRGLAGEYVPEDLWKWANARRRS